MAKLPALEQQLRTLIGLPSISSCSAEYDQSNRAVIDQLASWLSELGFSCEILPLSDKPGKANLIATLGSGSGGLVLSGHTDTVPYDDGKWQSDPFSLSERNNRFYGLGTSDMKGFFAVAIEAARQYTAKDLKQPIILLATADEESSMQGAKELAASGRPKARYAIVGEPTSLQPIRMHKGILMDKVTVHGRSGHSSNPAAGASAMDVMHSVLSELMGFRKQLARDFNHAGFDVNVPTMNLGCIHGGDNPNRICGQCELQFDVRALPGMDNAGLRDDIAALIAAVAHRHEVKIDYQPLVDGVPAYEQAADSELVKAAEKLTGHTAGSVAFGTEAPFFQGMGMETIVLGPGSIDQAHQPDEYMELHQIKPCVKLLRQLIDRFCVN
ncbi:MAG: acetylornithine deacetylase [Pseudomonadales bacterium]